MPQITLPRKSLLSDTAAPHVSDMVAIDNHVSVLRQAGQTDVAHRHTSLALDQMSMLTATIVKALRNPPPLVISSPLLGSTIQEQTLTVATTNITPTIAATLNAQLVVVLIQDVTGGRLITWDSTLHNAPTNIDTTGNTLSVFTFIGRINPSTSLVEWYLQCPPLTGQNL